MRYFIKKSSILLVTLFLSVNTLAQKGGDQLTQISQRITNCLDKSYQPNLDSVKNYCRIGSVFTKFKVNEKGKIIDLSFSKRSPKFITNALKLAIDTMQLDRSLMHLLMVSGKTVIVPLLYYYKAGCNFPKAGLAPSADNSQFSRKYLAIYMDLDHTAESIDLMLNFEDKDLNAVDCILLSAYRVGAGSIE